MPITFDIPMREAPSSTSGICKMHHALITVPGPSRSNAEAREAHDTKWKPVMIDTLPPTATVKREVINNENSPYKSKPNTSIDIVKDLLSKGVLRCYFISNLESLNPQFTLINILIIILI